VQPARIWSATVSGLAGARARVQGLHAAFLAACRKNGFLWFLSWIVVLAIPLTMGIQQLDHATALRDGLTDYADAYGEADNIRAADGWIARGFGFSKGLPEIGHGDRFANIGGKYDRELCGGRPDCVYLHNPQGSGYVVWLGFKIYGQSHISKVRRLPIFLFVVATLTLLVGIARRFGSPRAAFVAVVLTFIPMFANMAHGLCYHGESLSLLLLLWAALLVRRTKVALGLAALASFGLGWLAYENAFLCALSPLAFAAFRGFRRRPTFYLLVACGGGFALAQVVHFCQVASFLGGFGAALTDLAAAGHKRTVAKVFGQSEPLSAAELVTDYLFKHVPKPEYFNVSFVPWYAVVLLLGLVRAPVSGTTFRWSPAKGAFVSLVVAVLAPMGWLVVMRQHSTIHTHFLPRMFVMPVVCGAIFLAASLRRRVPRAEALATARATKAAAAGPASESPASLAPPTAAVATLDGEEPAAEAPEPGPG